MEVGSVKTAGSEIIGSSSEMTRSGRAEIIALLPASRLGTEQLAKNLEGCHDRKAA